MQLLDALQLNQPAVIAMVGAGGKTTAMFILARALKPPVIITTTTHLGRDQVDLGDGYFEITSKEQVDAFFERLEPVTVVAAPCSDPTKVESLSPDMLQRLAVGALERGLNLLIEADGSRGLPLKAPAAYEPAIPDWVQMTIVVAGLSGLGRPLDGNFVHRPEIFSRLSGLAMGEPVTREGLSKVLRDLRGGRKNIPAGSRRVLLLSQADTVELQAEGHTLARGLVGDFERAIISGTMRIANKAIERAVPPEKNGRVRLEWNETDQGVEEKGNLSSPRMAEFERLKAERYAGPVVAVHTATAGIILAGGQSSRLGRPKQLLTWRGEPFIRKIAITAMQSGLSPVIVVTGAVKTEIETALEGLPVKVVHNPDWAQGQSTSLKIGLSSLSMNTGAAIFMLSDQPQIPASLITALVEKHQQTLAPIVAPQVDGKRANPVLFDHTVFPDLQTLTGDTGGRAIFSKHPVTWIPWYDPTILIDVDSPEDYQKFLDSQ